MNYMSTRKIISIVSLVLLTLLIFVSRKEIIHAWDLLGGVNLWILALLIPTQIIVYYSIGEMMFEYLRAKGGLRDVSRATLTRMALELNFVNHLLPSGGVSGISYMTWRFGLIGVSPARGTMAQLVRYIVGFLSYLVLLLIAVIAITLDQGADRMIILGSGIITTSIIFIMVFSAYIISDIARLRGFAVWGSRMINRTVKVVTLGRKRTLVTRRKLEDFLTDLHRDYLELMKDKRILIKPFLWGLLFNIADTAMFLIGFWALGASVNPAAIILGYGIASFAGFILLTPGGAGGYEAIMAGVLSASGVPKETSIAAVVLVRVILLLGTIISGYIFYQLTIMKHGKRPIKR